MMTNISENKVIREISEITQQMYKNGWHEINSGNLSIRLDDKELEEFKPLKRGAVYSLDIDAFSIRNKYFIVSATGKYFRNIHLDIKNSLGIIKISNDGKSYQIVWGFENSNGPTSELDTHLLTHMERVKFDSNHKVVIHAHPTNILAMTHIFSGDERDFTKCLWKMTTEGIVVFPDGVSVLPWMLCGTKEIGYATAKKIQETRLVVWSLHGVFAVGSTLGDTYGLLETVEKSAEIYMMTLNIKKANVLSDDNLRELAKYFKVKVRKNYLNNIGGKE